MSCLGEKALLCPSFCKVDLTLADPGTFLPVHAGWHERQFEELLIQFGSDCSRENVVHFRDVAGVGPSRHKRCSSDPQACHPVFIEATEAFENDQIAKDGGFIGCGASRACVADCSLCFLDLFCGLGAILPCGFQPVAEFSQP